MNTTTLRTITRQRRLLLALAIIAITLTAITLGPNTTFAAPATQQGTVNAPSKANLKQVPCKADPTSSICVSWTSNKHWVQTMVKVYAVTEGGMTGDPFSHPNVWSGKLVREIPVNTPNHGQLAITGLSPGSWYLVTVEGRNGNDLEGKGPSLQLSTMLIPEIMEVKATVERDNPQEKVHVSWHIIGPRSDQRFEIVAVGSRNRADIEDNSAGIYQHTQATASITDHTVREHTFTGLQPDHWYRFEITVVSGGAKKIMWTEPVRTARDPADIPPPRCVSRFDTGVPGIQASENKVGLLSICLQADNLKDGRNHTQTVIRAQSLDGNETYQQTLDAAPSLAFIPMSGIREGQKYRVATTAVYQSSKHGTEQSAPAVELLTHSQNHRPCRSCPDLPAGTPVTISIESEWSSVWRHNGEIKFVISLSRPLQGLEHIELPISISGGEPDRHWNVEFRQGENGPGVKRTTSGKQSGMIFSKGGQFATFTLIGRDRNPDDDQDRSIRIEIGAKDRTTIMTNLRGNGSFSNKVIEVDIVRPEAPEPPAVKPVVSVTAGSDVTEGQDATFTVTASPAPASSLDVLVIVTSSGHYGFTGLGRQTVTIPTSGSVGLTVGTTDDNVDETDGSVTATAYDDIGHTVSATQGEATVAVADNDVPEIGITGSSAVTEGENITFTVTASPTPASNLDVSVTVAQSGDFGVPIGQRTVTVSTTGSTAFTVSTTDDAANETDGFVTAAVHSGSGYTVSATQWVAVVDVSDDDDPPDYTDYQTVVDYLIQVRDNPENQAMRGNPDHIRKWNRVLAAIGYDSGEQPMMALTIHLNAHRWPDSPFHAASVYLRSLEQ